MPFADRLKALRQKSGLTQEGLAQAAGLRREAVARLELGTREPLLATAKALAKALGVDCTAFDDVQDGPGPKGKSGHKRRPVRGKP